MNISVPAGLSVSESHNIDMTLKHDLENYSPFLYPSRKKKFFFSFVKGCNKFLKRTYDRESLWHAEFQRLILYRKSLLTSAIR